ncbi:hypothetical protein FHR72_000617 [Mycolicibacterium iranicum]|uniref:Uncharacterized protein n=1 Tax=Mycolicibacterium iranicum TaxID=912594 RepID=A0A839PYS3_MYCIR|nr:hypothetical protein [Mycolicibacterium iranicum]MBB2989160.1 hypothetical protein [Mycolicibacterium iranicum]
MTFLPARLQEQIDRVDRTRSLIFGISAGVTALWAVYRVFWLLYSASVLSSVGLSSATLLFSLVLWTAVGLASAAVGAAFLIRYARNT